MEEVRRANLRMAAMLRCAVGVVAVFLASWTVSAPSPNRDSSPLRPGLFLYAAPGLLEPRFAETVVLLMEHGPEGSTGLVVNRPTDVPLHQALEEAEGTRGAELPLYWGGPVQPEAILALVRSRGGGADIRTILPDVHLTGDIAVVRKVLEGPDPHRRVRVYSGYAGWAAGQLWAEVRAGAWVLDVADADLVFAPAPSTLWERVHEILNRVEVRRLRDAFLAPSTGLSRDGVRGYGPTRTGCSRTQSGNQRTRTRRITLHSISQ